MPLILAEHLGKSFRAAVKQPGLAGTLRHLFKREYRTIEAVRDASFTINEGEIVGFLGPNGAGKTTTLKMLSGLIHPSAGRVEVAGHDPFRRRPEFLREITLVMGQKQQLVWDLPLLDSLRINAAVYEVPEAEAKRRIDDLSRMLGLKEQLTQAVRKLSLGERMKAELMAALLHRPRVLFLDEPTLGLDVNAQVSVRDFLRDYNKTHGATILLTSHYMADISALCKRVMMIHQGNLMYDGSLDGLLARFSPSREVKVELARSYPEDELRRLGPVESVEGRVVTLIVPREELTATVSRVLGAVEVADLTVTDPPLEKVIGGIFDAEARR